MIVRRPGSDRRALLVCSAFIPVSFLRPPLLDLWRVFRPLPLAPPLRDAAFARVASVGILPATVIQLWVVVEYHILSNNSSLYKDIHGRRGVGLMNFHLPLSFHWHKVVEYRSFHEDIKNPETIFTISGFHIILKYSYCVAINVHGRYDFCH